MKKILSLLLCLLVLTASLCACQQTTLPNAPLPESEPSVGSDTEPKETEPPAFAPSEGIYIDGIDLKEYRIVIPENCDISTKYAAMNLSDYLLLHFNMSLTTVTDDAPEQPYEILIGDTNRVLSQISVPLDAGKYVLMNRGGKLVMQGEGIYVGAGVGYFVSHYLSGLDSDGGINITDLPSSVVPTEFVFPETCNNAILMIGDGMGYNHINMALANGLDSFVAQQLPVAGSAVTRSQSVINGDASYTDSAAAGTALATGYKTINGYIGKNASKVDCQNLRELADSMGAKTAVITTDALTGATPAAFLAHNIDRNNTAEIQDDIDELKSQNKIEYCAGSMGDRLTEETRTALSNISDSDAPFFIMVEGAYIDKYSHNKNYADVLHAVQRFNDAIAYVIQFTFCHPDTALIITADHETGGITESPSSSYGYTFTTGNHTNQNVPVYAIGAQTSVFHNVATENINISKFIANIYGNKNFGQSN